MSVLTIIYDILMVTILATAASFTTVILYPPIAAQIKMWWRDDD